MYVLVSGCAESRRAGACTAPPSQAKHIRESYNRFRANRDQSITEIHEFVKKVCVSLTQTRGKDLPV